MTAVLRASGGGSTGTAAGSTSATAALPGTMMPGDRITVAVWSDTTSESPTVSSPGTGSWFKRNEAFATSGTTIGGSLFTKVATAGDVNGTLTVSHATSQRFAFAYTVTLGVTDTGTGAGVISSGTATASLPQPSTITGTGIQSTDGVRAAFGGKTAATGTFTVSLPAGWTAAGSGYSSAGSATNCGGAIGFAVGRPNTSAATASTTIGYVDILAAVSAQTVAGKTSTLIDDFSTDAPSLWGDNGRGTTAVSGGTLTQQCTSITSIYNTRQSVSLYDLTSSSLVVKVGQIAASTSGTANTEVQFGVARDTSVVKFVTENGTLHMQWRDAATNITEVASVAYNQSTMPYWRIRHDGTNVLWETSSDATTWTTRGTAAASGLPALNAGYVILDSGYWNTGDTLTTTTSIYDAVNPSQGTAPAANSESGLVGGTLTLLRRHARIGGSLIPNWPA